VLLRAAARQVFAEKGYAASGLADIAKQAGVSKTLMYHYFPSGRPELFIAVHRDLQQQLVRAVRFALGTPLAPERRLHRMIAAIFDFFEHAPDAFRLLFREPWGTAEPAVITHAGTAQAQLAGELSTALAASGAPASIILGATSGTLGFVFNVVELAQTSQIDREGGIELCTTFIVNGLGALALWQM
jgi:AcrR family transcriptional regulator